MKNRKELDAVMLSFPGGLPVDGLKPWERGSDPEVRSKVTSAIFTEGLDVETFRKMARNLLLTGKATIQGGFFRLK